MSRPGFSPCACSLCWIEQRWPPIARATAWRTAAEALALMASGDQVTHGLLVKGSDGVTANPLVGIAHRAAADMVRYAGEFGMSPSARARIAAGPFESQTPSKFAGLLGGYDDERA